MPLNHPTPPGDYAKLAPCPFCGSQNVALTRFRKDMAHSVDCLNCEIEGPECKSADEAITRWNTRPPSTEIEQLRGEKEALQTKADKLGDIAADWQHTSEMSQQSWKDLFSSLENTRVLLNDALADLERKDTEIEALKAELVHEKRVGTNVVGIAIDLFKKHERAKKRAQAMHRRAQKAESHYWQTQSYIHRRVFDKQRKQIWFLEGINKTLHDTLEMYRKWRRVLEGELVDATRERDQALADRDASNRAFVALQQHTGGWVPVARRVPYVCEAEDADGQRIFSVILANGKRDYAYFSDGWFSLDETLENTMYGHDGLPAVVQWYAVPDPVMAAAPEVQENSNVEN